MPLPSLHPSLPQNPTAGSSSFGRSLGSAAVASSANAGGSVNRDTLKGLQDVVWSDDEDDPDCLLCAEPLDLSDLNFKPCQCGLQICQFCYNKLLGSDPRCPGCRRLYDQKSVIFQPVDFEEVKRAKEKKTKRAKTIKQLTTMGRRHLLGTRVVMKNMVYVIGMPLPSTPEESPSILRTHEYFGQYGKIAKIYVRERSLSAIHTLSPEDPSTTYGIYIIFTRREDAARAIALINANTSVNGFSASYGTTRYCDAFLRGMKCDQSNCHNLHEWGGESDCFSKDDYETALTKPAEYDARQKQAQVAPPPLAIKSHWPKPNSEDLGPDPSASALPNSAGWGKNITVKTLPAKTINGGPKSLKIGNMVSLKPIANNTAFPLPSPSVLPIGSARSDKKKSTTATAMSRGKSSDSTQSTNPPSSAQASPRKKPISLTTSTSALASASTSTATPTSALGKTAPPPGIAPPLPPPGLGPPMVQTSTSAGSAPTTTGIAPLATATATASVSVPVAAPAPTELVIEDSPEETMSADSEAGPSSSSPAPQTPSQPSEPPLPAPLTSDPIFVHSPYEEPEFFPFPTTSDPDFEFVLGLDFGDAQTGNMSAFTPTPFSKTLMGLADLGVLSTDVPDYGYQTPHRAFTSNFQPFDLSSSLPEDEQDEDEDTPQAGPSRSRDREDLARQAMSTPNRQQEEAEPPRTTSRFQFARQSSSSYTPNSYSRGQSPFAMRTGAGTGNGNGNGMGGMGVGVGDWGMSTRQMQHQQLLEEQLVGQRQQQQNTGDSSRASALVPHQQESSYVGSYGSSAGQEWHPAQSSQSQSQSQSQGQGSEYIGSPIRLDGRMSQLSLGRHPQGHGQRDEYDHHLPYGGPQPQPQRLFSPESSLHEDQQQQHYHHHPQQQQQQSQYTPLHQTFYQQQQQQQARTQSPVPMSINPHSFRRY